MPKKFLPLILIALLALVGAAIYHFRGDLAGGAQESIRETLKAKSGGDCWYANVCGDLAYYDCGADTDAPAYFVNLAEKKTVGECGGTCRGAGAARCQGECPPAQWNCELHTVNPADVPKLYSLNEDLSKERSLRKVLRPFDSPFPRDGAAAPAPGNPAGPKEEVFAPAGSQGQEEEQGTGP
ncbi:MAG: hypothetical protein EOP11_08155 [Proteobacteria bacterium]|nr:MAG: hypothetical protein EOP11_08155 [Pseudomonadota bacterium]